LAAFAEKIDAEFVDRGSLDARGTRAELVESRRDLFGSLVGEGERADAFGRGVVCFYKEADALDEAERLAGARSGDNEKRLGVSLDCCALGGGGRVHDIRRLRTGPSEGDVKAARIGSGRLATLACRIYFGALQLIAGALDSGSDIDVQRRFLRWPLLARRCSAVV